MAGSYNHAIDKTTGKLLSPDAFPRMVENLGDAYETVEEMYGMIWWLATALDDEIMSAGAPNRKANIARVVEQARQSYQDGLDASPGTDGELTDDE